MERLAPVMEGRRVEVGQLDLVGCDPGRYIAEADLWRDPLAPVLRVEGEIHAYLRRIARLRARAAHESENDREGQQGLRHGSLSFVEAKACTHPTPGCHTGNGQRWGLCRPGRPAPFLTPWKPPANLGTLALRSKPPGSRRKEGLSSPVPGVKTKVLPTRAKETLSPAPTTCIMISLVELRRVGIVFSPDGHYIYIGNFTTRDPASGRHGRCRYGQAHEAAGPARLDARRRLVSEREGSEAVIRPGRAPVVLHPLG